MRHEARLGLDTSTFGQGDKKGQMHAAAISVGSTIVSAFLLSTSMHYAQTEVCP